MTGGAGAALPGGVLLALDASTYVGSVAVLRGREVLAEGEVAMRGATSEALMPAVADALARAGATPRDLAAVACGAGPGSFTSLRIAAAIAKGIASAQRVPLYAVSSLWLVVAGAPGLPPGEYVAALDAMRGDVFALGVTVADDGSVRAAGAPALVRATDLDAFARERGARIAGPGRALDLRPLARGVAREDPGALASSGAVSLATWEPAYGRLAEAQVKWEASHGRPLSESAPGA